MPLYFNLMGISLADCIVISNYQLNLITHRQSARVTTVSLKIASWLENRSGQRCGIHEEEEGFLRELRTFVFMGWETPPHTVGYAW